MLRLFSLNDVVVILVFIQKWKVKVVIVKVSALQGQKMHYNSGVNNKNILNNIWFLL